MPEFLKKLIENVTTVWGKLSLTQKLIGSGVIVAAVVVVIVLLTVNSGTAGVPLFSEQIDIKDFGTITRKLQEENIPFSIKDNELILVKSSKVKNETIMMLAQEGVLPKGNYTFLDIINDRQMTTSKFENNIKLRAAMEGKLEELLAASELIDDADVSFTMPERIIWQKEQEPVRVAVMLTPSWNVNLLEHKKAIQGIEELVVNSIDRATSENVVITDQNGVKLNDFSDQQQLDDLRMTRENLKTRERIKEQYRQSIYNALSAIIDPDRLSVVVDVQMNFDKETESRREILPVVLKEDDPATPYDDGERVYSITESSKTVTETFKGPNWIPEGPPGFDDNVPPAYKGALEQMTEYIKDEKIRNETFGEARKELVKDPWEISRISASVMVDGSWQFVFNEDGDFETTPDGNRKREYVPVSDELIRKLKGFVEQGVGFSVVRRDKVEVYEFPKDRTQEHLAEDAQWRKRKQVMIALFAGLIALMVLIIATIIYRIVAKEIERRKRLREEELARQHQLAREMALKSAEEENVEVEMSLEDKARLEMQENAINIAREHPEDVAQLVRTWLTEE
jgi:flagellar M-ring protein FliF